MLQLTRALRELRARGAARLRRAPRCHQAGAAAPALHQLCAASGEATSKQSWPRLAPGAGAGVGTLGTAPHLLPWGNFSLGTGRPPRSSASPQRAEGSPGSLCCSPCTSPGTCCSAAGGFATRPTSPLSSRHHSSPAACPQTPGWPRKAPLTCSASTAGQVFTTPGGGRAQQPCCPEHSPRHGRGSVPALGMDPALQGARPLSPPRAGRGG